MLRRKPTAIAITSEDLSTFEDFHARQLAYAHFQKTGQDPHGYFANSTHKCQNRTGNGTDMTDAKAMALEAEMRRQAEIEKLAMAMHGVGVDPNDELKPLPGDKARIVRSREERIMGTMGTGGGGSGSGTRR